MSAIQASDIPQICGCGYKTDNEQLMVNHLMKANAWQAVGKGIRFRPDMPHEEQLSERRLTVVPDNKSTAEIVYVTVIRTPEYMLWTHTVLSLVSGALLCELLAVLVVMLLPRAVALAPGWYRTVFGALFSLPILWLLVPCGLIAVAVRYHRVVTPRLERIAVVLSVISLTALVTLLVTVLWRIGY